MTRLLAVTLSLVAFAGCERTTTEPILNEPVPRHSYSR